MKRWVVGGVLAVVVAAVVVGCTPLVKFERPAPWELAEEPSPRDTSLVINVIAGGCNIEDEVLGGVVVEERPERVTISAAIRKPLNLLSVCNDIASEHRTVVELREPLGDRPVLDTYVYPGSG